MQCLTPDKLTGFFSYVVVVCESIFVVELMSVVRRFRDILDTIVRGGGLVKIGANGLLCLWSSCCGMHSDKAEW